MLNDITSNNIEHLHKEDSLLPNPRQLLENNWHGSIIERFLANARNLPDSICLASNTEQWNYCEVENNTRILAETLMAKGVKRGSIIVIIGKRAPSLALAMLAVIRAGCAFLIVDPKYPSTRIQQYVDFAQPLGIINLAPNTDIKQTFSGHLDKFWIDLHNPISKSDCSRPHALNDLFNQVTIAPNDLLYIAFTSGTTGVPKAILGSHSPVSHFFHVQTKKFNISSHDRVSVLSGLAHDPLLRDVLMPFWVGASSWYPNDEVFEYPGRLLQWLHQSEITISHITPSLCHFMLHTPRKKSHILCNNLRLIFFGGERLTFKLADHLKRFAPSAQIINCYGATETPQVVGWHLHQHRNEGQLDGVVPIGKGIDNSQLLILDENKSLCGVGEMGQIYVRTPHLPIRVVNISGDSTENFILNPYTGESNDRMYATGDYGKYLADGTVVYHGRKDRQYKIRGFRVDLSEIENVIRRLEQVDAFELIANQERGIVKLTLFITLYESFKSDTETIRQELEKQLPSFMMPEQIFVVPVLPRTPNGKVDHKTLQKMATQANQPIISHPITPNSIESKLLQVLRKSLNNRMVQIQLESELTKCGIDSLKMVEICCLIEQYFGIEISTSQLLSCANVKGIAAMIASHEARKISFDAPHSEHPGFVKVPSVDSTLGAAPRYNSTQGIDIPTYLMINKSKLIPGNEPFIKGTLNRFLQLLARVAPDVWRVKFHKWRGVYIGKNVSIGYDTILETSYPYLIHIGNNVNIGMRVTVIGHFRGMTTPVIGKPTVKICDYSFVGPGVIILPNTEIGEGAVIAAGSIVSASVQPMTMVQGNPAKLVAICGIPLSGRATYSEFIEKLKIV